MKRLIIGSFLMAYGFSGWALGQRQEIVRLQNDVLQLSNQIRLLQKSIDDNQSILQSLLEQLNDQVAESNVALQSLSQAVQGQRADSSTTLAHVREEVQNLSLKWDDVNNRIAALQRSLEEGQMRSSALRSLPAGGITGGAAAADQLYASAFNDYLMGNLELAVSGFQEFLTHYPESEFADNAAYYVGVCYFDQERYEQAIQAFDQVINLYPRGDKVAVSYYKTAQALEQLQRNSEAIEALRQLIAQFPDSPEATLAREQLQRMGVPEQRGRTPPTRRR